jgi:hypothetical protein
MESTHPVEVNTNSSGVKTGLDKEKLPFEQTEKR